MAVVTKVVNSSIWSGLTLFVLLFFMGCDAGRCNFKDGWRSDEEYIFDHTSIDDSTLCDLVFYFEFNRSYSYRNINLELVIVDPEYKIYKDRVSIMLDSVTMYRRGQSEVVISNLKMKKGDYRFRVKENMCDTLLGVNVFKMRIVPKWEKTK